MSWETRRCLVLVSQVTRHQLTQQPPMRSVPLEMPSNLWSEIVVRRHVRFALPEPGRVHPKPGMLPHICTHVVREKSKS